MARFPLLDFRFDVWLPTGTMVTRIRCPDCASLHHDICHGEERICFGCGHVLSVNGLELLASEVPDGWWDDEEFYTGGEDPDNPTFWYDLLN